MEPHLMISDEHPEEDNQGHKKINNFTNFQQ